MALPERFVFYWRWIFLGIKSRKPCRIRCHFRPAGGRSATLLRHNSRKDPPVKKLFAFLLVAGLLTSTTGCPSSPTTGGTTPTPTPKKDEPKKDEPKKDEPKKDEPKKDEPKKDEPAIKKDEPKKDEPKKDDAAKAAKIKEAEDK